MWYGTFSIRHIFTALSLISIELVFWTEILISYRISSIRFNFAVLRSLLSQPVSETIQLTCHLLSLPWKVGICPFPLLWNICAGAFIYSSLTAITKENRNSERSEYDMFVVLMEFVLWKCTLPWIDQDNRRSWRKCWGQQQTKTAADQKTGGIILNKWTAFLCSWAKSSNNPLCNTISHRMILNFKRTSTFEWFPLTLPH